MQPQRVPRKEHLKRAESLVLHGSEEPSNVVTFASHRAEWPGRITAFLREHPRSPRLAVLLHLLPDFLTFPAERRAFAWHWVREQLQSMEAEGEFTSLES